MTRHMAEASPHQVTAIGPLGLDYLDPADDPRNKGGGKPA